MLATCVLLMAIMLGGCHAPDVEMGTVRKVSRKRSQNPIRRVICLYHQRPWLNLDAAGDRDPEGVHYRVFLDAGKNSGELRDGEFHIELYQIIRKPDGTVARELTSAWTRATVRIPTVKSKILGMGYHLQLRWSRKETAGNEIEVITEYRDPFGGVVRSATKRLRVPHYPN